MPINNSLSAQARLDSQSHRLLQLEKLFEGEESVLRRPHEVVPAHTHEVGSLKGRLCEIFEVNAAQTSDFSKFRRTVLLMSHPDKIAGGSAPADSKRAHILFDRLKPILRQCEREWDAIIYESDDAGSAGARTSQVNLSASRTAATDSFLFEQALSAAVDLGEVREIKQLFDQWIAAWRTRNSAEASLPNKAMLEGALACADNLFQTGFDRRSGCWQPQQLSLYAALSEGILAQLTQLDFRIDSMGNTFFPLHVAAAHNNLTIFDALLAHSELGLDLRDQAGDTVLHVLAKKPSDLTSELLSSILEQSRPVDLNVRDAQGRSPLLCAFHCENDIAIDILRNVPGVDLLQPDNQGRNAFFYLSKYQEKTLSPYLPHPGPRD